MTDLTVTVRVKPGSSRNEVGGRYEGPQGPALIVAVTARAVDGAATTAVLRSVAAALDVRRSAVSLLTGRTSRDKVLSIAVADTGTDADTIRERVKTLRDGGGQNPSRAIL